MYLLFPHAIIILQLIFIYTYLYIYRFYFFYISTFNLGRILFILSFSIDLPVFAYLKAFPFAFIFYEILTQYKILSCRGIFSAFNIPFINCQLPLSLLKGPVLICCSFLSGYSRFSVFCFQFLMLYTILLCLFWVESTLICNMVPFISFRQLSATVSQNAAFTQSSLFSYPSGLPVVHISSCLSNPWFWGILFSLFPIFFFYAQSFILNILF